MKQRSLLVLLAFVMVLNFAACKKENTPASEPTAATGGSVQTEAPTENASVEGTTPSVSITAEKKTETADSSTRTGAADAEASAGETPSAVQTPEKKTEEVPAVKEIRLNAQWTYADYSVIHTDAAKLYRTTAKVPKGKVICINAGHGCKGGSAQFTLCHPDGSPKVTGGSTKAGAVKATSINEGTVLNDGTPEADATLALALQVKETLLANGYDVLLVRETKDAQLDNIARTVIANNNADCHISLHYDSSQNDKGLFFIGVPDIASYRNMEPVKSHFQEHTALGEALVEGERAAGVKIYSNGRMNIDLTQTSYSTVPSVDLEVGDRASASITAVIAGRMTICTTDIPCLNI